MRPKNAFKKKMEMVAWELTLGLKKVGHWSDRGV